MKLGIDVDDVLADFVGAFKQIVEQSAGKLITEDPVDWEFSNWHLTPEQLSAAWKRVEETENFWYTLARSPGANPLDLMRLDQKHTLFFITSRILTEGLPTEKQTAMWLNHRLGVMYPTVIVTNGMSKGPIIKALQLDAFIDDRPKNLCAAPPDVALYLRDTSHNKEEKRFTRVATFEEFAKKYVADNG